MKFTINNTELKKALQKAKLCITRSNTLPVLDMYHCHVSGSELTITSSDLENTLSVIAPIENLETEKESEVFCMPADQLNQLAAKTPDIPITIQVTDKINKETGKLRGYEIAIYTDNGNFTMIGENAEDYPDFNHLHKGESITLNENFIDALKRSMVAVASDELRPVMECVYVVFTGSEIQIFSTDNQMASEIHLKHEPTKEYSFMIHSKSLSLFNKIISGEFMIFMLRQNKDDNYVHSLAFSNKTTILQCRLTEGIYPNVPSIFPQGHNIEVIIDRHDVINAIDRVRIFANQSSHLAKLDFHDNKLKLSGQDIDFSCSGNEILPASYEGEQFIIGCCMARLSRVLKELTSDEVSMKFTDPKSGFIIQPIDMPDHMHDYRLVLMPYLLS